MKTFLILTLIFIVYSCANCDKKDIRDFSNSNSNYNHIKSNWNGKVEFINPDYIDEGGIGIRIGSESGVILDSSYVKNVENLDTFYFLNDSTLLAKYKMIGGSDLIIQRSIIFQVSNKRIFRMIDVISNTWSFLNDYRYNNEVTNNAREIEKYLVEFELNPNGDTLKVLEHYSLETEDGIDSSYATIAKLHLDKKKSIFMSKNEILNGQFMLVSNQGEILVDFNSEHVPSVRLSNNSYFLIQKKWYMEGRKSRLIEMF